MDITIEPGTYIVAVSGGVDSVVLLDLLRGTPDVRLVVAHFDHGIRQDSDNDRQFVRRLTQVYGLPFVSEKGRLGATVSEAAARKARYEFLRQVRMAARADAIVTAHHQDDVLETAILNIIRGTGRRGLTSLQSTDSIRRPLLHVSKQDILRYAQHQQLQWREDSTNASDAYRRNYVRHNVLPKFGPDGRQQLHDTIVGMRAVNAEIEHELRQLVASMMDDGQLDRQSYIMLPHAVAREVMAAWLGTTRVGEINRKLIERLVQAAKTLPAGRRVRINHNYYLTIGKYDLALTAAER